MKGVGGGGSIAGRGYLLMLAHALQHLRPETVKSRWSSLGFGGLGFSGLGFGVQGTAYFRV